jgi:hypothetical protein
MLPKGFEILNQSYVISWKCQTLVTTRLASYQENEHSTHERQENSVHIGKEQKEVVKFNKGPRKAQSNGDQRKKEPARTFAFSSTVFPRLINILY